MRPFLNSYRNFIETKENVYFWLSIIGASFIFLILLVSIIGIIYFIFFALFIWISQSLFIGNLKANAIKLTHEQFPEAYEMAVDACSKLEYMKLPDIYVLQSGGMLNALATKFCGRNFVVIYSDVLEAAYNDGADALRFIIAHELAHHKRNHLIKHFFAILAVFIPFLLPAYSRACEYTCDNIATFIQPKNALNGLLILLAGKKLYKNLNVNDFIKQSQAENGFCTWFAEIFNSHPHLYKRIIKVRNLSEYLITSPETSNSGAFSRAQI